MLCCTCRVARVEALPGTAWDVCPRRVPRRRATRAQRNAACACECLIWPCAFYVYVFVLGRCTALFPRAWGRGAQPQLMRSAGLIVLVRAFFAALQPHPRVSGAVGGVSQLSCACLPCCPPTASPRQWGRGGGSQQGWDIAAVHSLGCARAHGPGEQLSIRCSVCAGPVSRWAGSAPLLHLVARARESARATAGPLTL